MNKDHNVMRPGLDKTNGISYHSQHKPGTEGEDASATELDELLTVQEMCELLKVTKAYIYWLVHRKRIPYIKMQGHLRFRRSAIDEWLRSQEVRSNASIQEEIQDRNQMVCVCHTTKRKEVSEGNRQQETG